MRCQDLLAHLLDLTLSLSLSRSLARSLSLSLSLSFAHFWIFIDDAGLFCCVVAVAAAYHATAQAGRTCGTSPLSEADLQIHHAAGARFFYTQPLNFVTKASSDFFKLVDSSARDPGPRL